MVGAMIDAVVAGSLADPRGVVVMSPDELEAMHELRDFMFRRVYVSDIAAGQKHVAIDVIRRLVEHHLAHPEQIPESYRDAGADVLTQVVDYVSGMTDRFALATHDRLFDADATNEMRPLLPER
jgi:dGTPase